jgi:hypothetical protein
MPKGCGNPEPAAPITTPGCFGDRPPQSTIICGGIEKPDPGPMHTGHTDPVEPVKPILHLAQTIDDAITDIKSILRDKALKLFEVQSSKLEQYEADMSFEEALEMLNTQLKPNSITKTTSKDGKQIVIGQFDGGKVIIRDGSTPKGSNPSMATIETQLATEDKQVKVRLLKKNQELEL